MFAWWVARYVDKKFKGDHCFKEHPGDVKKWLVDEGLDALHSNATKLWLCWAATNPNDLANPRGFLQILRACREEIDEKFVSSSHARYGDAGRPRWSKLN